ncbi:kappaPI-actitoxin-Avd3a-like [Euwallacea fornicatus]|uniref:kappaPI-actitoxin-Avd3a-like n=1 Tax=Euwallacea fornicatus TaxID=995702 RepID=UPI00338FEF64
MFFKFVAVLLVVLCHLLPTQGAVTVAEIQPFRETDCDQPHTWGPINCQAYIEIYHWNNSVKRCEKAVYGGCRATANNFENLQTCENTAHRICS